MFDRAKKLQARFYQSAAGSKPVREWLLALPDAERQVIGKDIQKVEFGWPIVARIARHWVQDCGRFAANCSATGSPG